jgi:hypothetical protein
MILLAFRHGLRWHDTRSLQAYLGHRNIQNTVRIRSRRFAEFWRD